MTGSDMFAMGKSNTEDQEPLLGGSLDSQPNLRTRQLPWKLILVILPVVTIAALCTAILVRHNVSTQKGPSNLDEVAATYEDAGLQTAYLGSKGPKSSSYGNYRYAAVASDRSVCSTLGTEMLAKGGSVVDATITTMMCIGVHQAQSSGIGGGGIYTIYAKPRNGTKKELVSLISREVAPLAATIDMFVSPNVRTAGKTVAVPGEVKGYHEAWTRFGRLPWADLFAPIIKMCREGFEVGPSLAGFLEKFAKEDLYHIPSMKEILVKPDGTIYKLGDIMTRPKLADTFETLAKEGPNAFYDGSLSQSIIDDLKDIDSIITLEDLKRYKVAVKKPVKTTLRSKGWTMYSPPPPSSASSLQFMLHVMDGYKLNAHSLNDQNKVLTYHRIAETFKFAYTLKTRLGDPDFVNVSDVLGKLTSHAHADYVRSRINDDSTQHISAYGPVYKIGPESGTSHICILGPDGSAVSVTTTKNDLFGNKRRGTRTGIIWNGQMDDFSIPIKGPHWDIEASPSNFIAPGKRPLSSMSGTIILDKNGRVKFMIGASGGIKITTSTGFVSMHHLLMGLPLHTALDKPRLHHIMVPNILNHEPDFPQDILNGLRAKGHQTGLIRGVSVVQSISTNSSYSQGPCRTKCIEAVSDRRKTGAPDGY